MSANGRTARPHPCGWPWRTPCAAAGRARWPPPGVPYSWTPSSNTGKIPAAARHHPVLCPRPGPGPGGKPGMRRLPGGENILSPKTIDIGIAAQVADGVMVPVLRRVNERTMEELLEDYNRLIAQGRAAAGWLRKTARAASPRSPTSAASASPLPRPCPCPANPLSWGWGRHQNPGLE